MKNRETSLKTDWRCILLKHHCDNQFLNTFVSNGKNIYTIAGTNIKEIMSDLMYIGKFSRALPKTKKSIFIEG